MLKFEPTAKLSMPLGLKSLRCVLKLFYSEALTPCSVHVQGLGSETFWKLSKV